MSGITDQFINNGGKLFPSFQNLQTEIEQNYHTAQIYYKTKENLFKTYLQNTINMTLEKFQQEMTETAKKFNTMVVQEAEKILLAQLEGRPIPPLDEDKREFEIDINELVKNGIKFYGKKGPKVITRQGFTFEQYLASHALNKIQKTQLNNFALEVKNDMKQLAAVVGKRTFTRSDIGINMSNDKQIELQTVLNIADIREEANRTSMDSFLQAIEENGKLQNVFGFQVKAYDSSNSARWMNSQPLANSLNMIFNTDLTWSNNYASIYPYYFLSKYLINIINPVNVGIITKEGMEYTSEFLQHYRFYMEVAWNWHKKNPISEDYRGGGEEVSNVHVVGSTILMRQVKTGKSLALQAKNIKSTQRGIHKKVAWVDYT